MANIGFVGLGHMGLPMAINLLKAGHCVTGYDIQATACDEFARGGGLVARHLAELALNQDVLITMLQTGQQGSRSAMFAKAQMVCLINAEVARSTLIAQLLMCTAPESYTSRRKNKA